jgi:hypothetical protein
MARCWPRESRGHDRRRPIFHRSSVAGVGTTARSGSGAWEKTAAIESVRSR